MLECGISKLSMEIKEAEKTDFEEVFALWQRAGLRTKDKERETLEYTSMLERNPNSCLIAVDRGDIVGTVLGTFNGRRAWIYHIVIDPEHQGSGLGSKLMREVEQKLRMAGATKIVLGVHITNLDTTAFYQKLGFKVMNDAILFEKDVYEKKGIPALN